MIKFKQIMILSFVAMLFGSCCGCKGKKALYPFMGTEWQLMQFEGRAFDAKDGYFVNFGADGTLTGKGDCNRLNGSYTESSAGQIKVGNVAGTRMLCPDQQAEDKFLKMLQSVDSYKIDGAMLLMFKNSELVAMFQKKN